MPVSEEKDAPELIGTIPDVFHMLVNEATHLAGILLTWVKQRCDAFKALFHLLR